MKSESTLSELFRGNTIYVPKYQRAYSWETPRESYSGTTHTDVFLEDLEEHLNSQSKSPYYFGHFLFEDLGSNKINVIDGQQRLTTIVIFLAALFRKLDEVSELTEEDLEAREDIIQRRSKIHFSTVDYDNQLFRDYVIKGSQTHQNNLDTTSKERIVRAYDYFKEKLADQSEAYFRNILAVVKEATCTSHLVKDEAFAIQMFIFQNNRGKRPTNLEVVKAQFMHHAYLYGKDATSDIIEEIKERFETIYKSISSIEYKIGEDDVLTYTLRVYYNSLWESKAFAKINAELAKSKECDFVVDFTSELAQSFSHLQRFFNVDERKNYHIHSLVSLGGIAVAIPFILKCYKFGLGIETIGKLCKSFESIILRNRLIGTRADITSRINNEYESFTDGNKDIAPMVEKLQNLKKRTDYWGGHWRNQYLEDSLQGKIHRPLARFILWKYESHLKAQGQGGYAPVRLEEIEKPELEHIAPEKEPTQKPHGYPDYDDEFKNEYLDCLGNWLLLSKTHNCSNSNDPFYKKHQDYTQLKQQEEVRAMVPENGSWDKELIKRRKEKIIDFVLKTF